MSVRPINYRRTAEVPYASRSSQNRATGSLTLQSVRIAARPLCHAFDREPRDTPPGFVKHERGNVVQRYLNRPLPPFKEQAQTENRRRDKSDESDEQESPHDSFRNLSRPGFA